jgi:hypothetical protein
MAALVVMVPVWSKAVIGCACPFTWCWLVMLSVLIGGGGGAWKSLLDLLRFTP